MAPVRFIRFEPVQSAEDVTGFLGANNREARPRTTPHPLAPVVLPGETTPGRKALAQNFVPTTTASPSLAPTANENRSNPVIAVFPKASRASDRYFDVRQLWEGTVDAVRPDGFLVVTLRDLTAPDRPRERAELVPDDIPDGDRDLLAPGAIFYWSIGYEITITGQRNGVSSIRFRRLPAWTRSELDAAKREAAELELLFGSASPSGNDADTR
jgi:hypothetical protein